MTLYGSTITLTSEFVYDNAGKIVRVNDLTDVDGTSYPPVSTKFTYQNNNLTAAKTCQNNTMQ